MSDLWRKTKLSEPSSELLWELFHENSKTSRFEPQIPAVEVLRLMEEFWESYPYTGCADPILLPARQAPLPMPLGEAILCRVSARALAPAPITLDQLGALLYYGYGVSRDNIGTVFPRPFRTIPSGGGLYPLEIYFHSPQITGLRAGIYHYDPTQNAVRCLNQGDHSRRLSEALVQANLALDASILFFITAVFERTTFKYNDRGYRFALIEAGHLAQNMNLVATALGLGSLNVGGFYDRQIDDLLVLDGVVHSIVYIVAVGKNIPSAQDGFAAE